MGAPQSGADIYRDGKKMRAAPKERTRKEYGRRLTAGGNARAPQSGAEAEPPQSGGHIWGRETKAGPPLQAGTHREDMRAPLANRQSGYSYRNGYIWAPPARRDIYREEDMGPLQRSGATYCKGNESGPAPKAGTLRDDMGAQPTGAVFPT